MTMNVLRLLDRPAPQARHNATLPALCAAAALCSGIGVPAFAQPALNVLYTFPGGAGGGNPVGNLLVDSSGPGGSVRALYGADPFNGAGGCQYGCGLDYKLTPPASGSGAWTYTELYGFSGAANGSNPYGPLLPASRKIKPATPLYGTTSGFFGGTGDGTIYSLVGTTLTTIYTFTGKSDGGGPGSGVVADKTGALYATAEEGGGTANCGTVIKLTPPAAGQTAWTEDTIWAFSGAKDGCSPNAVVIGAHGVLYGLAESGGKANGGTAFSLTPPKKGQTAWTETTLVSFTGSNGLTPYEGPTLGADGVLYGTTNAGGPAGDGVVFELTPPAKAQGNWTETVLYDFTGGRAGINPDGVLLIDKDGTLYGTTGAGSSTDNGAIFKLTAPTAGRTAWTETTLWAFTGGADGASPSGGLVADTSGTLYGTSELNATGGCAFGFGCGVVFSLTGTGFVP